MKPRLIAAVLAAQLAAFLTTAAHADTTVSDVERELMCQCGCTMILETCMCGTADQMRDVISAKIEEGASRTEIVDYFVARYGERVLSAPTKKGFNLAAWVLPFAAVGVGGVGIYWVLRTWVLQGASRREDTEVAVAASGEELDGYRDRLAKEFEAYRRMDGTP